MGCHWAPPDPSPHAHGATTPVLRETRPIAPTHNVCPCGGFGGFVAIPSHQPLAPAVMSSEAPGMPFLVSLRPVSVHLGAWHVPVRTQTAAPVARQRLHAVGSYGGGGGAYGDCLQVCA